MGANGVSLHREIAVMANFLKGLFVQSERAGQLTALFGILGDFRNTAEFRSDRAIRQNSVDLGAWFAAI